jgi:hypothetical protein
MCDSTTHGREPLRSVTIGFLYPVRLSYPPLPYLLPFRPTFLYVQAMSSRFPASRPSGQQYSTYNCDPSAASATDARTLLFYFCPFLVPDQYVIYMLRSPYTRSGEPVRCPQLKLPMQYSVVHTYPLEKTLSIKRPINCKAIRYSTPKFMS